MTTTVDATASTTDAAAAVALTPDLQAIVQAAQAYAAKALATLTLTQEVLAEAQLATQQAQSAADLAAGYLVLQQKVAAGEVALTLSALPTVRPQTSGAIWNDGGYIAVTP